MPINDDKHASAHPRATEEGDAEGHMPFRKSFADDELAEDAEGNALKGDEAAGSDDAEGHGARFNGVTAEPDADAEGHGGRFPVTEPDTDAEGHSFRKI